jgi:uncharacterized protein DUF429
VITLGIDLAAQPEDTAACAIEWRDDRARLLEVTCGQDDEALAGRIGTADKVGIDVPFGWPDAFVDAVANFHTGGGWPEQSTVMLRYRETDRLVAALTGHWPLSVSTDRIGVPTFRAARLLSRLVAQRQPVDRAGAGLFVEVYPAAALRRWGFPASGYKRVKGAQKLATLLDEIRARTHTWLDLGDAGKLCSTNADALDALLASLVARAAALGLCAGPPAHLADIAAREGWIALPAEDALGRLAGATPAAG